MVTSKGIGLEERQLDAIEEAEELGIGANEQEAARALIDRGARSYGLNGHGEGDTRLRRAVRRSADALGTVSILVLGASLSWPDEIRTVFVLLPLVSALVMYGLDRVLGAYEPRVSAWLSRGEGV